MGLAAVVVTALATLFAQPAVALDSNVFELDGNATTDHSGTTLPDDWDRVCHSVLGTDCSTTNNANTSAVEFGSQTIDTGTAFTGGGSKDPNDISSWAYTIGIGGLPGKDALLNGFAARYNTPANASCPSSTGTCSEVFFGKKATCSACHAQSLTVDHMLQNGGHFDLTQAQINALP